MKGKQQSRRGIQIDRSDGCYPSPLPLWLGTTTAMFYGLLSLTVPFRPLRLWANIWLKAGGSGSFCPNSTTWASKDFILFKNELYMDQFRLIPEKLI